jgi:Glycine transporter
MENLPLVLDLTGTFVFALSGALAGVKRELDLFGVLVLSFAAARQRHFVIDGEAVILGVDGIADFNALHSRLHDEEVQLCAFDILVEGGDDLRKLPLHLRKKPSAAFSAPSSGYFRQPVRTRRDRPRPIQRRVPDGP